jgi:hypothetical protein
MEGGYAMTIPLQNPGTTKPPYPFLPYPLPSYPLPCLTPT